MHRGLSLLIGSCALAALVTAPLAQAVDVAVDLPAAVSATFTADGCTNNPGPFITLSGELALGGLTARLIFSNNEQGTHTHTADVTVDVVIIPAGESIRFAKQPPQGGVGGNPLIFLQLTDAAGNPLSSEVFLGRCVQGLNPATVPFVLPADASVDVATANCSNSPGPFITLSGAITLSGVNARLIFRNNEKGTHTHTADVMVDVVILPAGETITFAKQPPQGGVGGNPLISLQLLDGAGNPLGAPLFLGRCVQLSK